MEQIGPEALAYIHTELETLVEDQLLDETTEQVIRFRYGLGETRPLNFKEMTKVLKMTPKKMKQEILKAEKIVFNLMKKKL